MSHANGEGLHHNERSRREAKMVAEKRTAQRLAAEYDRRIAGLPDSADKEAIASLRRSMDQLWDQEEPSREQIESLNHFIRDAERRAGQGLLDEDYARQSVATKALVPPAVRRRVVKLHRAFENREQETQRLFEDLSTAIEEGDAEEAARLRHEIRINSFKGAFAGLGSATLLICSTTAGLRKPISAAVSRVSEFFTDKVCDWFIEDEEHDLARYAANRQTPRNRGNP